MSQEVITINDPTGEVQQIILDDGFIMGPPGPAGVGVPAGGTPGQVLGKTGAEDYQTAWIDQTGGGGGGIPDAPFDGTLYGRQDGGWQAAEPEGTTATHEARTDNPHGVTAAQTGAAPSAAGVPAGGNAGQILAKVDAGDFNTEWKDDPISTDAPNDGTPHGRQDGNWVQVEPLGTTAAHEARQDNPHNVTAAQVGADPAGTTATHEARTDNPHGVTAAQVGADPAGTTATHEARQDNPHLVTAAQVGAPTTAEFNTLDGEAVKSTPIRFIKVDDPGTDANTLYIDLS